MVSFVNKNDSKEWFLLLTVNIQLYLITSKQKVVAPMSVSTKIDVWGRCIYPQMTAMGTFFGSFLTSTVLPYILWWGDGGGNVFRELETF